MHIRNIEIDQGATFREQVKLFASGTKTQEEIEILTKAETDALTPIDLTGATIVGQVRERFDDTSPLATFTIDARNDTLGEFDISLSDSITRALDFNIAAYDIEVTYSNGEVFRELGGIVTFSREVTQ